MALLCIVGLVPALYHQAYPCQILLPLGLSRIAFHTLQFSIPGFVLA